MQIARTKELELATFTHAEEPANRVQAAWPIYRDTGAASLATVHFVLEPGMHLGTHTDSAEELLVVLEGEVEITVDGKRSRARAGDLAVVPAQVPHDVRGCGSAPARVVGVFPSNTVVSVFDVTFPEVGGRVVGTPPPPAALEEPASSPA